MITRPSMPRRSPRCHSGSYPKISQITSPSLHPINRPLFHESEELKNPPPCTKGQDKDDDVSVSSSELDRSGFADEVMRMRRYPCPIPKLFVDSSPENTADIAVSDTAEVFTVSKGQNPMQSPSSHLLDLMTDRPSTFAKKTQQPSAVVRTTQRQSTLEQHTQPPSTNEFNAHPSTPSDVAKVQDSSEMETEMDLRHLYVHLNRLTVTQQKAVAAAFNVVQQGTKKLRASRLFVVPSGIMERKKRTAVELLREKGLEKGKDFKADFNRTLELWGPREEDTVVPPLIELEAESGVQRHPRPKRKVEDESDNEDEAVGNTFAADTNISLEEFARLLLIFRDVPEAAQDLRKSGQDLRREELDISVNRHAFWTDRIEKIFNDRGFLTNHQVEGPLHDIDPGRPVTCFRSGSTLQDLFNKFRKEFTEIHGRWDVSGNMETASFINFCRLPRSTTLNRSGARSLIAFQIFKLGTSAANTLLLDFCSKKMAGSSGACLESGICSDRERGVNSRGGRKRTSVEVNDAIVDALQSISKSGVGEVEDDRVSKKQRKQHESLSIENKQQENERQLMNNLLEAEKQLSFRGEHERNNKVGKLLNRYFNRLVNQLEDAMDPQEQG